MTVQSSRKCKGLFPSSTIVLRLVLLTIALVLPVNSYATHKERFKDVQIQFTGTWFTSSKATKESIEQHHFSSCVPPVTWVHTYTDSGTEQSQNDQWWQYSFTVNCSNFTSPKDVFITEKKCINGAYWDNTIHGCKLGADPDPEQCSDIEEPNGNGQCVFAQNIENKSLGECCESQNLKILIPDPINVGFGNNFREESDYESPALHGLKFTRYYNSRSRGYINLVGWGWTAEYMQAIVDVDVDTVLAYRPDGKIYTFNLINGGWQSDSDVTYKLSELKDGQGVRTGWRLMTPADTVEVYNYDGQVRGWLSSITYRDGMVTQVQYNLTAAEGGDDDYHTLDKVIDPFGRTITFTHDGLHLLTMTDPDGKTYRYGRDSDDNLVSVTYPDDTPGNSNDNPVRFYHYDNPFVPHAMTSLIDENGKIATTWDYDDQGRVIMGEHSGGADHIDINYNSDGTVSVIDGLGATNTYHLAIIQNAIKAEQIDGNQCANCGKYKSATYDSNGFISSRTDFNGNTTTYVHNSRGLETSRTEAAGTPQERTITTEWSADFRLPTKITEPGKVTTFTYDSQGRLLERKETAQ